MSVKIESVLRVPKWLLETIRSDGATLPIDSKLFGGIDHIDCLWRLEKYQDCFVALPEGKEFLLVDGDAVYGTIEFDLIEYWMDSLEVIELFVGLTLSRGMHLLKSFVREFCVQRTFLRWPCLGVPF